MSRCEFKVLLQTCAIIFGFVSTMAQTRVFTNHWAVKITGGSEVANVIAQKYGFMNMGQVGDLDDHYHFLHPRMVKRSTNAATASSHGNHSLIAMETNVEWVEQQVVHHRVKRDDITSFNDPKWDKMWYLHCGQSCLTDMRIKGAWRKGYTGRGVVVSILDDGIERIHPDLKSNYDPRASWDFNQDDPDPSPRYDITDENKHGTRCAGVVAATANNSLCMVGIAYNARIGGIRMLDGDMSDILEAHSLSFRPQHIDIYSASWGPDDDGMTVDGPGTLTRLALESGIRKGRKGRGSIFVWASGNGGRNKDHCSCDGYTNSIYTISISSTTQYGRKPWYLEECASTLASTYSSGEANGRGVVTTDLRQRCTEEHSGTSASTPMAAGIIALTLEANPLLTWRDVQHIIVKTSRRGYLSAPDWQTNGAGHDVSHLYGFGLMDAEAMVTEAESWRQVPPHRVCVDNTVDFYREIRGNEVLRSTYHSSGCNRHVVYLEHVAVSVTLTHPRRGDLSITLVSPSGTRSQLLATRDNDASSGGFRRWRFMTTHCWGELAAGDWILEVRDTPSRRRSYRYIARMVEWNLVLYGTTVHPYSTPRHAHARSVDPAPEDDIIEEYTGVCDEECSEDGCEGPGAHQCISCSHFFLKNKNNTRTCVSSCPEGFWGDRKRCKKCYSSCSTCEGSRNNQCFSCKPTHHFLEENRSCVTSCGDGYYVEHVGNVCRRCSENCLRCTSPTICTQCTEGYSLEGTRCQKACPVGTFLKVEGEEGGGSCEPCNPACASCAGAGLEACKSCAEGYLIEEWKCVSSCSQGFYATQQSPDTRICRRCDTSCLSCVGPGRTNCSSCVEGHTLQSGVCMTVCKDGEYQDEQGSCHSCDVSCHKCRGPKNSDCINCSPPMFLDGGQCVAVCSVGKYQAGGQCHLCDHTCAQCVDQGPANCSSCNTDKFGVARFLHKGECLTACPVGFFHGAGQLCEACPAQCELCASANHCLQCSPSHFLHHGTCTRLECGEGEVEDPDYDDCMPCEEGCKKCVLYNPKKCMSCMDGYYRYEEGCHKHCPAKSYPMEQEMTCVSCDSNCVSCDEHECYWCETDLFLLDGKCVQDCPEGYYGNEDSQECEECDESCRSCSGPEDDECVSCQEGDQLQDGGCVPDDDNCPSKTYLTDNGECESCHSSCEACDGPLKSDCVTCVKGRYLTSDQMCVLRCPAGRYGSRASGVCESCGVGCAVCVNPKQCQRCQSTRRRQLYLQDGQCVQQCTSGFPVGQVCESCAEGCESCERNSTHCLSCKGALVLHQHQCLVSCPPDHTLRDGQCQHCPPGCHHCSSSGVCADCEPSHLLHEGHCVTKCPEGFYDDTEGRVCARCHPDCKVCDGPGADECGVCADADASLQNGECVSSCPQHTYREADTAECMACDPSCHTCVGPHATSCTSCAQGLRPDSQGRCATPTSCPAHHYADNQGECHQCHKHCHQCAGPGPHQCLACGPGHYLYNGTCVDTCPAGSFRDQEVHKCEACHPSCLSCMGHHSNQCLACKPELFRDGKECVETCRPSYYGDLSTRSCEPCDASCAECLGAGPESCLSCAIGQLYLRRRGQCVHTCPLGHYEDSHHRTCEPCHPSCKTCYSKGSWACESCHLGYSLQDGACESQCMMGEYPVVEQLSTSHCERCHDSCLGCRGPGIQNCTLCSTQYLLTEGGRCLPCCPAEEAHSRQSSRQQLACCNCTETKGECVLSTNFAFRNDNNNSDDDDDDDEEEERGNLALFIITCVLLVLGLGAVGLLVRRSLAKGPSKPSGGGPGRGYEKLSNSSRFGGGSAGGATSFSSESYNSSGGGGGGGGGRFREEQLVDLSDRSKGRGGEDEDDEDEDEDIVYMGQDGTVYRKFRYGQLGDDNEDELEYDDEGYTFGADPFADGKQGQNPAPQMV